VVALAVVAMVPAGLWMYESAAEWAWFHMHPAPGLLVDIGGYRLHLLCEGEGPPTVVLEAGLGDFSLVWHDVQRELSKSVHTCSYDRGGLGWSDPSPLPRDPSHEATELHRLLDRAHVPSPYILVGHAYGGDVAHVYAAKFHTQLAGVILVDTSTEDKWVRIPGMMPMWRDASRDCRRDVWQATFGLRRFHHNPVPPYHPATVRSAAEALTYTKKAVRASCDEYASLAAAESAKVTSIGPIDHMPLTVIATGKSTFDVQRDESDIVIQQVLRLVARARLDEPCCIDSVQN
jgi:pimeloyl-ACP methyl ester carboxylesterase